jgi:uncharacterized membrane protein
MTLLLLLMMMMMMMMRMMMQAAFCHVATASNSPTAASGIGQAVHPSSTPRQYTHGQAVQTRIARQYK